MAVLFSSELVENERGGWCDWDGDDVGDVGGIVDDGGG